MEIQSNPQPAPDLGLLQYWYTQSVSMAEGPQGPAGVYAQEVYAPRLVGRFAEVGEMPMVGEAPMPMLIGPPAVVPEPSTLGTVVMVLVVYGLVYAGLRAAFAVLEWLWTDGGAAKGKGTNRRDANE